MQERLLFEYAIVRLVPRVERGEYLNVGVVLYCKKANYLDCRFCIEEARLLAFYPKIDLPEINNYLQAFNLICRGHAAGGPIALLDVPGRFRWLTAKRSTIIQCSEIHPGFCTNPADKLQQLLEEMVIC